MGRLKSNSRVCDGTLSGEIAINGRVVLASHGPHTGTLVTGADLGGVDWVGSHPRP